MPAADSRLIAALHDALPQTQCRRCGYDDCRGYARAIAAGDAAIDRCPPGGAEGIARLSALTGQPTRPLSVAHGSEGPVRRARIDEAACIGCALCLKACPVDCILGAAKQMHTVIAVCCTGCALCLPACPVDCIALDGGAADAGEEPTGWAAWSEAQAAEARRRYTSRRWRLRRDARAERARLDAMADRRGPSPAVRSADCASLIDSGTATR